VMLQIAALSAEQEALEDVAEAAECIFPKLDEFIVLADEQIGGGTMLKMMLLPRLPLRSNGFKQSTIKKAPRQKNLGKIARTLNVSPNGNKRVVFNCIRDYPGGVVEKISEDVFKYCRNVLLEADQWALEQWIVTISTHGYLQLVT